MKSDKNRAKRQKRSKENFLPSRQAKTEFWGLWHKPVACRTGYAAAYPLLAYHFFQSSISFETWKNKRS